MIIKFVTDGGNYKVFDYVESYDWYDHRSLHFCAIDLNKDDEGFLPDNPRFYPWFRYINRRLENPLVQENMETFTVDYYIGKDVKILYNELRSRTTKAEEFEEYLLDNLLAPVDFMELRVRTDFDHANPRGIHAGLKTIKIAFDKSAFIMNDSGVTVDVVK